MSNHDYPFITLAITTDWVGGLSFLNIYNIKTFQKLGIKLASHSTSHPAMAITKRRNFVRNTPIGGVYENAQKGGFENKLSENQVKYQFVESKKFLEKNEIFVEEFVFPYRLYNEDIVKINSVDKFYKTLSTCDEEVDRGLSLRPRILITSEMTTENINEKIKLILETEND